MDTIVAFIRILIFVIIVVTTIVDILFKVVQVFRDADNGKCKVKRVNSSIPSRAEAVALIDDKSCYVKPFPMKTTIDEVKRFFEQQMKEVKKAGEEGAENDKSETDEVETEDDEKEKVVSVRLRRHEESKDFNGTLFVEFATVEDAKV